MTTEVSACGLARAILGGDAVKEDGGRVVAVAERIEDQRAGRPAEDAIWALSPTRRGERALSLLKTAPARRLAGPPRCPTGLDQVVADLKQKVRIKQAEVLLSVRDPEPSMAVRSALDETAADRKVAAVATATFDTLRSLFQEVQALEKEPALTNFAMEDVTTGLNAVITLLAPLAVATPPRSAAGIPGQMRATPSTTDLTPADPNTVSTPTLTPAKSGSMHQDAADTDPDRGQRFFRDPIGGQMVHIMPVGAASI
jgi:hypothetical protein